LLLLVVVVVVMDMDPVAEGVVLGQMYQDIH
jgi:hypothetical protein